MLINEIFKSIDGEGNRTGYPVTFIRSYSCNLLCNYCFGIKSGRNVPRVRAVKAPETRIVTKNAKSRDARIPIDGVKVGDVLFTYNNDLQVVTTTVTGVLDREVTEWLEIVIDGTEYFVTPEHPIFTTSGMKQAKDLKVGDLILHVNPNTLNTIRMKLNNPMYNPEVVQKSVNNTNYEEIGRKNSEHVKEKKRQGIYKSSWDLLTQTQRDEICKKISDSKLRENNPNWIENYPYRNYTDLKKNICNNPEQFTCERCGVSGTDKSLHVHHIDGNHENDSIENLAVLCSTCHNQIHERGYNFWVSERSDGKKLLNAVCQSNGKQVESIKYVDIKEHKYYGRPYGPKPLHVYNISCSPYNTYFLDDMWVHNCDTLYAVKPETEEDKANAFKEMSIEEIIGACIQLKNRRITFTGGEPLIQKDAVELVGQLMLNGFEVNIETNGAVNIEEFTHKLDSYMDAYISTSECTCGTYYFTLDYKCPTSGMEDKMILSNLDWLSKGDVLKFVVGSIEDLNKMKQIITEHKIYAEIFISPVFGNIDPKDIVKYIIDNDLQDVRVQLQLHKIIWDFKQRGV